VQEYSGFQDVCVSPVDPDSLPAGSSLYALEIPRLEPLEPSSSYNIPMRHSGRGLLLSPEPRDDVNAGQSLLGAVGEGLHGRLVISGLGKGAEYQLRGRLGQGHFGEVWRAFHSTGGQRTRTERSDEESYVLKRLMVEKGQEIRLSGYRETYFGELLRHHQAASDSGITQPDIEIRPAGLDHIVSEPLPYLISCVHELLWTISQFYLEDNLTAR